MTTLLDEIVQRAKAVQAKDIRTPKRARRVKKGEKVIGVLPEGLRRLYAVLEAFHSENEQFCDQILEQGGAPALNKKQRVSAEKRLRLLKNQFELVSTCFWNSVRHMFTDTIGDDTIGLRKSWKVVTHPKDTGPRGMIIQIPTLLFGN